MSEANEDRIQYARAGGGVYWHIIVDRASICGFKPSGKGAGTRGAWANTTYNKPLTTLIHPRCLAREEGR